ncbi:hypothetical protein ACFYPG_23765 [Micromonospora sp. NPDC005553]|uniref:hypothetical protein n=1 Tax=Micromonospora sp. NPDC005553 TaxID=3364232 RepID=UPI003688A7CA
MTVADRLADPLAAVWHGHRTEPPARVLTSPDDAGDLDPAPCAATTRRSTTPMLFDRWGDQPIRLAINVTASDPAGEFVRTLQELPPHEAFPGGPP